MLSWLRRLLGRIWRWILWLLDKGEVTGMAQVIDYSVSHPPPADITAAGYVGCMRYLAPLPNSKVLQAPERDALFAAGLKIGLIWETTAARASEGYDAGKADAQRADAMADDLGWPTHRPIYYAVDFDAPTPPLPAIEGYFAGVRDNARHAWGFYGEYEVIEAAALAGETKWFWQCSGWSGFGIGSGGSINGRRLSKYALLFQRVGYVLGDSSDVNDVLADDWGGYHPNDPTPSEEDDMTSTLVADPDVPGQWWEVLGMERRLVNAPFGVSTEKDILAYVITQAGGKVLDESFDVDFRRFLMNARVVIPFGSTGGNIDPAAIAAAVKVALADDFDAVAPGVIAALQAQLTK